MAKRASARPGPAAAPGAEATWSKGAVSFRLTPDRRLMLESVVKGLPRRPSVTATLDLALEWAAAARASEAHPEDSARPSISAHAARDMNTPTASAPDAGGPVSKPMAERSMLADLSSAAPQSPKQAAEGLLGSGFLESDLAELRDASIRALERSDANAALLSRLGERSDACFALLARIDDRLSELCQTISSATDAADAIDASGDGDGGDQAMTLRAWLEAEAMALPKRSLLVLASVLPGFAGPSPRATVERVAAAGLGGHAARGLPGMVGVDGALSTAFKKAGGPAQLFLMCQSSNDGGWTVAAHRATGGSPADKLHAFAV